MTGPETDPRLEQARHAPAQWWPATHWAMQPLMRRESASSMEGAIGND